jgi:hypothetical protein
VPNFLSESNFISQSTLEGRVEFPPAEVSSFNISMLIQPQPAKLKQIAEQVLEYSSPPLREKLALSLIREVGPCYPMRFLTAPCRTMLGSSSMSLTFWKASASAGTLQLWLVSVIYGPSSSI